MHAVYDMLTDRVLEQLQQHDSSPSSRCVVVQLSKCSPNSQNTCIGACIGASPPVAHSLTSRHRHDNPWCRCRQPWLVGVAGVPGSGKSTLVRAVCERLNARGTPAVVVPMDGFHYYRRQLDQMPDAELAHARRGAEWTFDARAYHACLAGIKSSGGWRGAGMGALCLGQLPASQPASQPTSQQLLSNPSAPAHTHHPLPGPPSCCR
jgi:pantothenate kinase